MKKSLLIVSSVLASSTPALAIGGLNLGAYIGYQIVDIPGDFDGGGVAVGAEFYSVFGRLGAVGVIGGLGLEYTTIECSNNDVKIEADEYNLGFMGGLNVPFNDNYSLQSLVRYDFGIDGEGTSPLDKVRGETEVRTFYRLTHEWRLLAEIAPRFTMGASLKWFRGDLSFQGDNVDIYFKGYTIGAVAIRRF